MQLASSALEAVLASMHLCVWLSLIMCLWATVIHFGMLAYYHLHACRFVLVVCNYLMLPQLHDAVSLPQQDDCLQN